MQVTPLRPPKRAVAPCPSDRPVCPRCGNVLGRIHVPAAGASYVTCIHGRGGEKCGQQSYIVGSGQGVCWVIAITREEFDTMRNDDKSAREVFRDLGILVEAVAQQRAS